MRSKPFATNPVDVGENGRGKTMLKRVSYALLATLLCLCVCPWMRTAFAANEQCDVIEGSGWSIELPTQWYGKAGAEQHGDAGAVLPLKTVAGKTIPYGDEPVLNWEVVEASRGKKLLSQGGFVGDARLKSGQKVSLRSDNPYEGYVSFTVELVSGQYLNVSAYNYVGYNAVHASLQTLGRLQQPKENETAAMPQLLEHIAQRTTVRKSSDSLPRKWNGSYTGTFARPDGTEYRRERDVVMTLDGDYTNGAISGTCEIDNESFRFTGTYNSETREIRIWWKSWIVNNGTRSTRQFSGTVSDDLQSIRGKTTTTDGKHWSNWHMESEQAAGREGAEIIHFADFDFKVPSSWQGKVELKTEGQVRHLAWDDWWLLSESSSSKNMGAAEGDEYRSRFRDSKESAFIDSFTLDNGMQVEVREFNDGAIYALITDKSDRWLTIWTCLADRTLGSMWNRNDSDCAEYKQMQLALTSLNSSSDSRQIAAQMLRTCAEGITFTF